MGFEKRQYHEPVNTDYRLANTWIGYYIVFYGAEVGDDRYVRRDGTIWSFMDSHYGETGGTYFDTKEEAESLLASLLGAQK